MRLTNIIHLSSDHLGWSGDRKKESGGTPPIEQWFQFDVTPLDSVYQLKS